MRRIPLRYRLSLPFVMAETAVILALVLLAFDIGADIFQSASITFALLASWAINRRLDRNMRLRLFDLAEALGMNPPEGGHGLRLEHDDHEDFWWLVGCAQGDCVLPETRDKGLTSKTEVLETAEAWIRK